MVTDGPRIVAVVTLSDDIVPGGVPIFRVENEQQRERVSVLLARILRGVVHDLENGAYVIVRH